MNLVSLVILFPTYIWIIYRYFRKKIPKLFVRLGVGITFYFFGVVSLLIADIMGHALNRNRSFPIIACVYFKQHYPKIDH